MGVKKSKKYQNHNRLSTKKRQKIKKCPKHRHNLKKNNNNFFTEIILTSYDFFFAQFPILPTLVPYFSVLSIFVACKKYVVIFRLLTNFEHFMNIYIYFLRLVYFCRFGLEG